MPHFKTITLKNGLIGLWKLTETDDELAQHFTESELIDAHFAKYTYSKRRAEWLATRLLIRQMIGSEFKITYLESRKPIIAHHQYKFLSISHSNTFAAVILHENVEVGIDIEDTTRNFNKVAQRYLSDKELAIADGSELGSELMYCLFWCAKEALYKLVSEHGVDFKNQIHISANEEQNTEFKAKFLSDSGSQTTYPIHFCFFDKNCMAWSFGKLNEEQ